MNLHKHPCICIMNKKAKYLKPDQQWIAFYNTEFKSLIFKSSRLWSNYNLIQSDSLLFFVLHAMFTFTRYAFIGIQTSSQTLQVCMLISKSITNPIDFHKQTNT